MVVWCGEVNGKLLEKLVQAGEDRSLILSSQGGCVNTMRGIMDLLNTDPWIIVGTGWIQSAAVPIIASGARKHRFASSRTRFMVHNPSITHLSDATPRILACEAKETAILADDMFDDLGRLTKKSAGWWRAMCSDAPYYFSAKEAKRLGVVDKVG